MTDILQKDMSADLGFDRLSEAERNEALAAVGRVIYEAVLWRVIQVLDEPQRAELDRVLETAKDEHEILAFLERVVPDLDAIIREETIKFKTESLALMQRLN